MAKVALSIGGFSYEIACRDGEEAHFTRIAAILDAKAAEAGQAVGGLTETRMLLFAGLLLADETAGLRTAAATPPPPPSVDPIFAEAIAALAGRIERLAEDLEGGLETEPRDA